MSHAKKIVSRTADASFAQVNMSSRSFLLVTYLVLNPNPVYMHDCTDNGSWRFSTYESLPLLECADDPDWRRRHVATGDCAWIGELPGSRCDDKDENGIKAEDACGCACGPTAAPSVEPVVYDCAWVGENSTARCGSVSELKAEDACPKTCGDGTKDSGTWYLGEIHKNCDFPPRPRAPFETSPLVRTQVSGSARIRTRSRSGATKWARTRRWRRARSRATPRAR